MRKQNKFFKSIVAILVAIMMMGTLIPTFAFATEETPVVEETTENNTNINTVGNAFEAFIQTIRDFFQRIFDFFRELFGLNKEPEEPEEPEYDYSNAVIVNTKEEAQAALDNATSGTLIKLVSGVDYGVLYLRPNGNAEVTKVVDWIGNNYRYETYSLFDNLTIVGAEGATVDAIEIEGGTYYNTAHSQADKYPIMLSLIELKNVIIDGVIFTGKGGYDPQGHGNAINLSGSNIKVNGLTFKNCVLNDEAGNARLLYKTEGTDNKHEYEYNGESFTFVNDLKNITVTNCTFNGGYMGLEIRETENVTITNNTFNGVASRDMLLPVNGGFTYSGSITITGNKSVNAGDRFIRGSGIGNATLIIKDNVVADYMGKDADYIKVDGVTGAYDISNNTITDGTGANRTFTITVA